MVSVKPPFRNILLCAWSPQEKQPTTPTRTGTPRRPPLPSPGPTAHTGVSTAQGKVGFTLTKVSAGLSWASDSVWKCAEVGLF